MRKVTGNRHHILKHILNILFFLSFFFFFTIDVVRTGGGSAGKKDNIKNDYIYFISKNTTIFMIIKNNLL